MPHKLWLGYHDHSLKQIHEARFILYFPPYFIFSYYSPHCFLISQRRESLFVSILFSFPSLIHEATKAQMEPSTYSILILAIQLFIKGRYTLSLNNIIKISE